MKAPIPISVRSGVLAVAALATLAGCASLEGTRRYESGTRALEAGRPGQAVAELEEAARLLPDSSAVQNHLGLAYVQNGRDEDATRAFRRAVELDCSNDAAQHNLRAAEAGHFRPPGATFAGADHE